MASIAKTEKEINYDSLSIEELKKGYNDLYLEIKTLLQKNPDMDKMSNEIKSKLKVKYVELANYSRKLALRTSDLTEKETYQENYSKLIARAQDFGSTIKGRVPKTTLDDVKGLENVKKVVKSFIFLLQNPQIREYYHIDGGLGMMLYGAPGTGKSMFAEAVANALQLPLFTVTPADISIDEIVNMSELNSFSYNQVPSYYSGADISGIVEEACRYACEILEAKNETTPIPLTREMFQKAFNKIKPSISQDVLDEYENFKTRIEI